MSLAADAHQPGSGGQRIPASLGNHVFRTVEYGVPNHRVGAREDDDYCVPEAIIRVDIVDEPEKVDVTSLRPKSFENRISRRGRRKDKRPTLKMLAGTCARPEPGL